MTATRKDFIALARAIDESRAHLVREAYKWRLSDEWLDAALAGSKWTARKQADALANICPRFDRRRFLLAALDGEAFGRAWNERALAREIGPATANT